LGESIESNAGACLSPEESVDCRVVVAFMMMHTDGFSLHPAGHSRFVPDEIKKDHPSGLRPVL
jgi:hypothetical protein